MYVWREYQSWCGAEATSKCFTPIFPITVPGPANVPELKTNVNCSMSEKLMLETVGPVYAQVA